MLDMDGVDVLRVESVAPGGRTLPTEAESSTDEARFYTDECGLDPTANRREPCTNLKAVRLNVPHDNEAREDLCNVGLVSKNRPFHKR